MDESITSPVTSHGDRGTRGRWLGDLPVTAMAAGFVLVGITALVICAPWIARAPTETIRFDLELVPPQGDAWFGTDELGRDLFGRVLFGLRTSLIAAVAIVIPAAVIGVAIGTFAGYYGGVVDQGLMRLTDLVLAFPYLILALAIAASLGPSIPNAVLALLLVWWPSYARIMRGLVSSLRTEPFVVAARALGASGPRIILKEIMPHAWGPVQTKILVDFGYALIALASLSFIGLGAQPPDPELGSIIFDARNHVLEAWWYGVLPGVALLLPVVALNVLGDALQDRGGRYLPPRGLE
jgi:peptide/nickel transport system permease protein